MSVRITVGKFLAIRTGRSSVVSVITDVDTGGQKPAGEAGGLLTARVDLLGEIKEGKGGAVRFQRGITDYPVIGDQVDLLGSEGLRLIYDTAGADTINIGQLQQDSSIGARIKIDDMLRKHFALFGSTGVGKSSGVAVILREILEVRPDLRIFLIDPHNEYGHSFGDRAQVLNPKNLQAAVLAVQFRGNRRRLLSRPAGPRGGGGDPLPGHPAGQEPVRQHARGEAHHSLRKLDSGATGYTVDTPVPYRLSDLVSLIDERMGKLENRSTTSSYSRLVARIETVRKDPRYAFMFDNANVGGDTMVEVLGQLFRLPANGKPMTVMQLAGFPAEVVDSVVSVLGRMAFDFGLWSDGAVPLLFVCEEAHRYAPGDKTIGFGPTRKAISRIAKEGRKYGVFLGARHAAAGRARRDHHLPVQHHLRHAHGQRARPEHHPLGRLGCGRQPARLRALARHARGVRLRRGRGAADAAALQRARRRVHPEERVGEHRPHRSCAASTPP